MDLLGSPHQVFASSGRARQRNSRSGGLDAEVMSVLAEVLRLDRLRRDETAWVMLRAESAPLVIGFLAEALGGETRRLPVPVLHGQLTDELTELRAHDLDYPSTAQQYCDQWRRQGILIRRGDSTTRGETYELSPSALAAIHFVTELDQPRNTVSGSRLATIVQQLRQLVTETDPRTETRVAALLAQREALDRQIERVASGRETVLRDDIARERATDILALTAELPTDFARVRLVLEHITRDLRRQIVESDDETPVLDDIFRGVDELAQSDEGRSFEGFHRLIVDDEVGALFVDDVAHLLDRPFARRLDTASRAQLRTLLPSLRERSFEVHEVMTQLSSGLRRFVQNREYRRERALQRRITETSNEALHLTNRLRPAQLTEFALVRSTVPMRSIGALRLHNPADDASDVSIHVVPEPTVDLAELRRIAREVEIDWAELRRNVNQVLATVGPATVGTVLAAHPATQGVASLVGLLLLADEHGEPTAEAERVEWTTPTGRRQAADIEGHRFVERIP